MAFTTPTVTTGIGNMGLGGSTGGSSLQTVLDILGSKGGQTLVGAAGAGLQAYGASKDRAQDRAMQENAQKQNAAQFAANMLQRQGEDDRNFQLQQAQSAAGASPLGESQKFAQRNAIMAPLLTGARNFSITPGDPAVAAAMGAGAQGGLRLPEGGLDPNMINRLFGDSATLESIKNRQQQVGALNPSAKAMDLGAMFGESGTQATGDLNAGNSQLAEEAAMKQAQQRDQIMRAIDEDITGERRGAAPDGYEYDKKTGELKKKGSIWKTIGKVASIAAPIVAAPFTGGASLALIGAGAGAANGLLSGGGVKGALLGGATGGALAGLGGLAGGAGKAATLSTGLKQAAKNPALYSAILGGAR